MLNPPRKVKRLREIAPDIPHHAQITLSPPPPPPQQQSVASSSDFSPPVRRRGRKPAGPLSKSAREQLRKENHSVIEKRRREKINDALSELRSLVDGGGKCPEENREFKLEILERTVVFVKGLVERIGVLEKERSLCAKCSAVRETGGELKRKRTDEETTQMNVDVEPKADPGPSSNDIRLPSISSWLDLDPNITPLKPMSPHQLPSPPNSGSLPILPRISQMPLPGLVLPPPISSYTTIAPSYFSRSSPSAEKAEPSSSSLSSNPQSLPSPLADDQRHPTKISRHDPEIDVSHRPHDEDSQRTTFSPLRAQQTIIRRWSHEEHTAASLLLTISSQSGMAEGRNDEEDEGRNSQVGMEGLRGGEGPQSVQYRDEKRFSARGGHDVSHRKSEAQTPCMVLGIGTKGRVVR